MSAVLNIHELDSEDRVIATFPYAKRPDLALSRVTSFEQLIGDTPLVYVTGLHALKTQKKLEAFLTQFGRYKVTRDPVETGGVTARSHVSNGMVAPINVRGG